MLTIILLTLLAYWLICIATFLLYYRRESLAEQRHYLLRKRAREYQEHEHEKEQG